MVEHWNKHLLPFQILEFHSCSKSIPSQLHHLKVSFQDHIDWSTKKNSKCKLQEEELLYRLPFQKEKKSSKLSAAVVVGDVDLEDEPVDLLPPKKHQDVEKLGSDDSSSSKKVERTWKEILDLV